MQWIALAANGGQCGPADGVMQLQQNRTLMRAQVRHELASTIVDLLNSSASNSQLRVCCACRARRAVDRRRAVPIPASF